MNSRLEYTRLAVYVWFVSYADLCVVFSTDNGPDTEIGLKIVFSNLVYDSDRVDLWKTEFSNKVR